MVINMAIFILSWLVCSLLGYGWMFAYFQREYPILASNDYKKDLVNAALMSIFGPITVMVALVHGAYKHGLKFI
jgi:hypothetical protein